MFTSLKTKFIMWKLRKKKPQQQDTEEPNIIQEFAQEISQSLSNTAEEISTIPIVRDVSHSLSDVSETVGSTVQETYEEVEDALHYYFNNPKYIGYDVAYEMTIEDLIFPVSTK